LSTDAVDKPVEAHWIWPPGTAWQRGRAWFVGFLANAAAVTGRAGAGRAGQG